MSVFPIRSEDRPGTAAASGTPARRFDKLKVKESLQISLR